MTLMLTSNNYITEDFIRWLVREMSLEILCDIDYARLHLIFDSLPLEESLKKRIDLRKSILMGTRLIRYEKVKGNWKIYVDNNVVYPKTNVKVVTLCRLVDNGFLGVQGIHIFNKVFNHVKQSLSSYYNRYIEGV